MAPWRVEFAAQGAPSAPPPTGTRGHVVGGEGAWDEAEREVSGRGEGAASGDAAAGGDGAANAAGGGGGETATVGVAVRRVAKAGGDVPKLHVDGAARTGFGGGAGGQRGDEAQGGAEGDRV